ncbi:uncharacterized protein LOC114349975 [Ostrinia furnacalis]|uniref:uncharacterized protein LOC114349975 n=1 Tax=Ostrinia furnacalis TaxID=93504 RepID=UPI00103B2F91|nr:uncharacterized protein LOC114349975 [Ostrinia furnacalis]
MADTTTNPSIQFNESEITSTDTAPGEELSITESVRNVMDAKQPLHNESQDTLPVFEAFIIIEIVMTALELIIWGVAALKMQRWRKNYRNQMLLQLSVVRFLKRLVFLIVFMREKNLVPDTEGSKAVMFSFGIYVDFVIVILVFFFIKHMYDSLIVVMVKISENSLWKMLTCAWLVPVPISCVCSGVVAAGVDQWLVQLLICCLVQWPLMLLGTILYLTILYRVLKDKIRKFARSLTVITFLLCLVINFYLFSNDIIKLFCLHSFLTLLISYVSGFLMNFLILLLYIILIIMNFRSKSSESVRNHSISIDK